MKLPQLALKNHQFFLTVIILLFLSGIISFLRMPRSEDPQVSPAGSSVIVIYPGANPLDMEELVVNPIEDVINELEDIKTLTAVAEDGLAVIAVEFVSGSDPDEKYSDVVQKVNSVRNALPEEILSLDITKWSITDVNIIQIALVSEFASYRELENESEELKKRLEKVSGVKTVDTWAFPEQEIRISLNLAKMAHYRVPLQMIIGAIKNANENIPGGNIDIGSRRFNIKTSGSYQNLEDIRNTIISSAGGKLIYLRDIADVDFAYEDQKYYARYNGRRAVFVTCNQKEGTNIFDVEKGIKEKVKQFQEELPNSIGLHYVFDQSRSVASRVSGFFNNLLQGLILVGAITFLVIGFRASVIVMIAIPTSILIGMGFIDVADFGLQQMTIAGLVIALGLLVDNAIVVTENISRFIKKGHSHSEAASKGTSQIAWAVVSSTITTVLAFIPMMMIGDVTGDFIRSMPVSVVLTLLASLFISLTLTPYLSSRFLPAAQSLKTGLIRKFLDKLIERNYRGRLRHALDHPWRYIGGAIFIFVLSLSFFQFFVSVSFFPKAEKPQLIINIDLPDGSSIHKTAQVASNVESVLLEKSEIKHFATNIGRGNPRLYYNVIPENEKSTHAQIFIEVFEYQPKTFAKFIGDLRSEFSDYPGAKIEVKEFEQGPPVEAPIAIRILGDNLDSLKTIARDLEEIMAATTGTININNPLRTSKTDLHININRAKAGLLGIPLVDIDRAVRTSIAGLPVSSYHDAEGKDYQIVLQLPTQNSPDILKFDNLYVSSFTGTQIPLKQVASIEFKATPMVIDHYNLDRNVTLTSDVISDYSVDEITNQVISKIDQYDWPRGYRYAIGGELESREESFGGMMQAVLIAMISIFAVLVLQFRSYSQPLIVFSAIPLALVGSVVTLFITGNSFSFTAFVGLTSLIGIVVNNSIILVDYSNQLREEGKNIRDALMEAGETRFVPIILTTATTIGGLLPLTLAGGSLWAPMGWTIIGGLIASTMLTLLIVPVLYLLYSSKDQ
jgi:multidrug efflux pump subunit AcrB